LLIWPDIKNYIRPNIFAKNTNERQILRYVSFCFAEQEFDKLYEKADNKMKREIIGSIYPEKLVFDGFHYRTARLNEAVSLIYSVGKGFSENKNGQSELISNLSTLVTWIGFEPMTLSLEG
jgi:hypothetical protein